MLDRAQHAYAYLNRARCGWLIIPAVAALCTSLYWFFGYVGDDFEFHTSSWLALHQAFAASRFEMGWMNGVHQGLGSPQLTFYPPLSLLIDTLVSFLVPFRIVPGVLVWLILSAAGLSMYTASARLIGKEHRLTASFLYMLGGYMVLATIRRYDLAESWVDAALPLTFLFYLKASLGRRSALVPLALLLAFGWLTNVPAAIVTLYAFGITTVYVCCRLRGLRPMVVFAAAEVAALAVAAFRLGPVFVEKQWIHTEQLLRFHIAAKLIFAGLPRHQLEILFLNACVLCMLGIVMLALRVARRRSESASLLGGTLLTLTLVAVFFQTPLSLPLWRHLPEMLYVAFVFRFQPYLMLAAALLLCMPGVGRKLRVFACVAYVPLAVFPYVNTFHEPPSNRFSSITAAIQYFEGPHKGVEEYLPKAVTLAPGEPDSISAAVRAMAGRADGCSAGPVLEAPDRQTVNVAASSSCEMTVGTFCYPYWTAHTGDGRNVPLSCNADGLILAFVPGDTRVIDLVFEPHSFLRTCTAWLSGAALAGLLLFGWKMRNGGDAGGVLS